MSKDEKFTRAASQRERAACLDLPCVDHARGFACDDPELFARLQATIDNEPAPSTGLRGPRWGRGPAAKASRQLTEWFADWARRARRALTNLESVGPIEREAYVAAYTALRAAIHTETAAHQRPPSFCVGWPSARVLDVRSRLDRWATPPKPTLAMGLSRDEAVGKAAQESWERRVVAEDAVVVRAYVLAGRAIAKAAKVERAATWAATVVARAEAKSAREAAKAARLAARTRGS